MTEDSTSMSDEQGHPRIRERRAEVEDRSLRIRNRRLIALGVILVLAMLAAASTQSALLDVDEVTIIGAERTDPEVITDRAALEPGTALLGLDLEAVESRVRAMPEVRAATATRSWGGTVTIEILERLPVARVEVPEGVVLVAPDGVVVAITDEPHEDLPLVSGVMFTTSPGRPVPDELNEALLVAAAMPADIAAVTERIEISVDSLVLRVVGGGEISMGDGRLIEEKFGAVRAFLAQVDLSCLRSINVAAPRVPVIVRTPSC